MIENGDSAPAFLSYLGSWSFFSPVSESPSNEVFLARVRIILLSHTINCSIQAEDWLMLKRLRRETKILFLPEKKKRLKKKTNYTHMFYIRVIDNENISRGIFEDERKKKRKKRLSSKE